MAQRSKQSASTRTITGGYLEEEMFELGLEVLPGIQKVENREDRHPCQREMWLSSKRMELLSGKLTVYCRLCDCQAILKANFSDCGHELKRGQHGSPNSFSCHDTVPGQVELEI